MAANRRDIAGFARRVESRTQWIEAALHLLKREYLEPDWDEEREHHARERLSFLGLTLTANRAVNYGPIAPEESRRIFAREALVYQRLRAPDWLLANDAAVRDALRMESGCERAIWCTAPRFRGLLRCAAAPGVERGDSEYFTRHPAAARRCWLAERIFARARSPRHSAIPKRRSRCACDPGRIPFRACESRDGASLRIPILALPGLTRAAVDAAVPGFGEPRIEGTRCARCPRTRRNLIPLSGTRRRNFASIERRHGARGDAESLKVWLKETRTAFPESQLRFDLAARPGAFDPATDRHRRRPNRGAALVELRR